MQKSIDSPTLRASPGPSGEWRLDGEFGEHAVAKRAGFRQGDIIVSFDGQVSRMSESELLAYALQKKRVGDEVTVTVLRNGEKANLSLALR